MVSGAWSIQVYRFRGNQMHAKLHMSGKPQVFLCSYLWTLGLQPLIGRLFHKHRLDQSLRKTTSWFSALCIRKGLRRMEQCYRSTKPSLFGSFSRVASGDSVWIGWLYLDKILDWGLTYFWEGASLGTLKYQSRATYGLRVGRYES